ncbi:alpha/beta fold hydrolase [Pelagicoccus sp. SDUM812005]|uniref:alpha/beta fold hydrolase n=1 Tax=Pelagicoccus sp. SDUM812005 TaxID=3041257 RepID=UPI00280EB682|nr:alpha/beta fold hydrolase [Pelagicoccus sp. SDUM812005]MDQ8179176.1 alpha/beta fold hydrolase [Pelagicoccus sp. SDUM812005]
MLRRYFQLNELSRPDEPEAEKGKQARFFPFEKPRDVGVRSRLTWKATGKVMDVLERSLGVRLRVDGLENLSEHPTLYVVNHFTRVETFIIPYLLYKLREESARTLAHYSLFTGFLGRYISRLGAVSTKEEERDAMIVGDLMTGRKNWVIYPEGTMVKNKKFLDQGNFIIDSPGYRGPPRTGAAVLALQAESHRLRYLRAYEEGDAETMHAYEEKYRFAGPEEVSRRELVVLPLNITYYPIRPQENFVSQLARTLFSDLPERLEEELKVEGRILLSKTDMKIHFCPAIPLRSYLSPRGFVPRLLARLQGETQQLDQTVRSQRDQLTRAFMREIYRNVEVNFDHLFCSGLLWAKEQRVLKRSFHRALLLTALEFKKNGMCRLQSKLYRTCVEVCSGLESEALQSIVRESVREGVLEDQGDYYWINRGRFHETASFHDIRLRLTTKVIANEFEPLSECVEVLKRNVNQDERGARCILADELKREEARSFERAYREHYDPELSKPLEVGEPFDLLPKDGKVRAGVLLVHGYMAAPMEMRYLGEAISEHGYHCHGLRIEGHGTAPLNLSETSWKDWLFSVHTAYLRMACLHDTVYLVGFSMGGLLALLKASQLGSQLAGVVAINPAFRLKDHRAGLAGAADVWNGMLQNLHIDIGKVEYVENLPANPEINYTRNYVKGVRQLGLLISRCEESLPQVRCPCLVVQARKDPVVDATGVELIREKIGSDAASIVLLKADSHVIVTDEHRDDVALYVRHFFSTLELASPLVPELEFHCAGY